MGNVLTSDTAITLVASGVGMLWAFFQGTKLYAKIKTGKLATLESEAEQAVHETAKDFVEELKRASADGTLRKDEIEKARAMARQKFKAIASTRGEDVAKTLGYRGVDLLVEKAFARLKTSGVLMLVLLSVGLALGTTGCGGGGQLLPQVTTTYPDGRVETRTDTAAVREIASVVTDTAESISDRIAMYQVQKAEAKARKDAVEEARLDRLITIAEGQLNRLGKSEATAPKEAVATTQ